MQCIWGQRERPFPPKQHTFLTSTCLRHPLLLQSVCAGHVWVHTRYKYRKTQGFTHSITCDWDTASDVCRTRGTGMYHNTLPPQKKAQNTCIQKQFHTPQAFLIYHQTSAVIFPLKYLTGACRYFQIISQPGGLCCWLWILWVLMPCLWTLYLTFTKPLRFWFHGTKPSIYTYRSCLFPADVFRMNHFKILELLVFRATSEKGTYWGASPTLKTKEWGSVKSTSPKALSSLNLTKASRQGY